MSHDLDTLIREYGERLDARAPSIDDLESRARRRAGSPVAPRPRWVLALGAALVVVVALGGAAALGILIGGGGGDVVSEEPIPETWTTYTAADGLTGDCAVDLAVAGDGTLWAVAREGIFRFDGASWVAESLPAGFSPDCDGRAAPAPDGSMWFTGGSSVVRYWEGGWTIEASGAVSEESEEYQGAFGDVAVSGGDVYVVEGDALAKVEAGSVVWIGEQFQTLPWGEWSEEEPPVGNPTMAVAPDGSLWVAGGPGHLVNRLYHYDGTRVDVVDIPGESPGTLLTVAPDGSLWFSVEFWGPTNWVADDVGLLLRYDGESWTSFELGGVVGAAFSPDGTGWFVVDEITGEDAWWRNQYADPGLYRFEGGEWTRFTTADGLAGYDLTSAVTFFEGSVWVGTDAHGITRYQPGSDPVTGAPVAIRGADLPLSEWPDNATTTTPP